MEREEQPINPGILELIHSIPPEGLGIHATLSDRAKQIMNEGLDPKKMHPKTDYPSTFYYYFHPMSSKLTDFNLEGLKIDINAALSFAQVNAHRAQPLAIVFFKPLKQPSGYHERFAQTGTPIGLQEYDLVTSNNMLGYIEVDEEVPNCLSREGKVFFDKLIPKITNILKANFSSEPQSPSQG